MRPNEVGEREMRSPVAAEAWVRTADALLCGLNHALSNRVSSLGIVSLERGGRPFGAGEIERLSAEPGRFEDLLRLYRLLERRDHESAEPLCVPDGVADALALTAHHPSMRDVACTVSGDADTPPVLLVPSALVHTLAVLLCEAAVRLGGGAKSGGLHLSYAGDADWVTIAVETRTPVPDAQAASVNALAAVHWLLRGARVTQSESRTAGGGVRLEVRLATLANQRRLDGA